MCIFTYAYVHPHIYIYIHISIHVHKAMQDVYHPPYCLGQTLEDVPSRPRPPGPTGPGLQGGGGRGRRSSLVPKFWGDPKNRTPNSGRRYSIVYCTIIVYIVRYSIVYSIKTHQFWTLILLWCRLWNPKVDTLLDLPRAPGYW